jgi:hypothetical protein
MIVVTTRGQVRHYNVDSARRRTCLTAGTASPCKGRGADLVVRCGGLITARAPSRLRKTSLMRLYGICGCLESLKLYGLSAEIADLETEGKNRYSQTNISRSMFRSRARERTCGLKRSPAEAEPGFQPRGSPETSAGIVRRAGAWSGTRTSRLSLAQLSHSVIPNEVFGSWHGPSAHPRGMKMLYC